MLRVKVEVSVEKVPDLVSYSIMRFLNFDGSHIFLTHEDTIFHCVGRGICTEKYSAFLEKHSITHSHEVEFNCTIEEFHAWFKSKGGVFGEDEVSPTEYSDLQYLGFIFSPLKKIVRNGKRKAICSEFVAWALTELAGMKQFEDPDFLSPKEVWGLLVGAK